MATLLHHVPGTGVIRERVLVAACAVGLPDLGRQKVVVTRPKKAPVLGSPGDRCAAN